MKTGFDHFFKYFVLSSMLFLPNCSHYKNDNPFDVLYPDANYVLKANWKALPAIMYLDTLYSLPCTTGVGRDTFTLLTIDDKDTGFVDMDSVRTVSFNTLALSFKKEHIGKVHIIGLRPNGKIKTDSSDSLIVFNQFKPVIKVPPTGTVIRGPDTLQVKVTNKKDPIVTVYWRLFSTASLDSLRDTITYDSIRLSFNTLTSGRYDTLYVWARNTRYASDTMKTVLSIIGNIPEFRGMVVADTISCGDMLHLTVMLGNTDAASTWFTAIVGTDDSSYLETSAPCRYADTVAITMRRPFIDTGMVRFSLQLVDSTGLPMRGIIKDSCYLRYTLPALYIQQSIVVPINRLQQIAVTDLHSVAVKYIWNFASSGGALDTTNSPFKQKTYLVALIDTVSVYGVNNYGYRGKAVTATIIAKQLKYILSTNDVLFPSTVTAGRIDTFGVTVDSSSLLAANQGVYSWRIDSLNVTLVNTEGAQLSSIYRKFADSGAYRVSVIVRDSAGDSSNRIEKLVIAHRYAPVCGFSKPMDTTATNRSDTLRLDYKDTNPDTTGHIDSVYWDLNGDGKADSVKYRNATLITTFQNAATYKVLAWVRDNDGFVSPADSLKVTVVSSVPYFDSLPHDTVVYMGTTLLMRADFHPGADGASISSYYWHIKGEGSDTLHAFTVVNILSFTFNNPGVDTVVATCIDTRDRASERPYLFAVTVKSSLKPVVNGMTPDTVWQNHDTVFTVDAVSLKTNVPITAYNVAWTGSSPFNRYPASSFHYTFTTSGTKTVRLFVVDNQGDASDTTADSVVVRIGRPVVDSMTVDAPLTALFVLDTQTYRVWARDTNGVVDSVKVFWTRGDSTQQKITTPLKHAFLLADSGTQTLKALVKDNDGLWSDTLRQTVRVRVGRPLVRSIKADADVFVKERRRYTISAIDSAGKIDTFFLRINNGISLRLKDSTFDTAFATPGTWQFKVAVKNDRGMTSDTLPESIIVKAGKPYVTSITADAAKDSIFVLDSRTFIIKGQDTRGKIDSVKIAWNGTTAFTEGKKAAGDSAKFIHTFAVADTAIKAVRVRLVDTNTVFADSLWPIKIRLGRPATAALTADTPMARIFINDSIPFRVSAFDTNGTVDSMSFDNGSGTFGPFVKMTGKFMRMFAKTDTGQKTVRARVKDNDGILSDTASLSFTVHLGTPVLTRVPNNDSMLWVSDTLVCPFIPSTHGATVTVSAFDTNGAVVQFNWDISNGGYTATTSSPILTSTGAAADGHYLMKVTGKDDDSLTSNTLQFTFSPHQPPAPIISNCDQVSGGKKLSWSGKDPADSNATFYKIVIKKGSELAPGDENDSVYIVQKFKAGSQYASGAPNFDFSFAYTPTSSGTYYYQIIARNSRGQMSRCAGQPNFFY
jgi:hypothetical protein